MSSADPDRLDQWAGTSRGLDQSLSMRQSMVAGVHREFSASSQWGRFDASQLIDSVRTYVGYNEQDAARTAQIAASFREADSSGGLSAVAASGGVVTVSSAELGRAMVKKGMSISMQGSRAVGRALPEARVGRNAAGLIETVDGQPVDDYLRSVGARRAEQFRASPDQRQLPPEERVTAVALNRRTGEVFEGGPADVVNSAGESGISRIAHVGGKAPDLGNRLDVAQDQIELAEAFHRGGEAAMVPGLVRAARANIAEIRASGEGFDGLGRRLDSMENAMNRIAGPQAPPRLRGEPSLKRVPRLLEAPKVEATRNPPESERIFVHDGRFHRADTGEPLEPGVWSYLVDDHGNIYAVNPVNGHRSVLGDHGPVAAAGVLEVRPNAPGLVVHMNTISGGFPHSNLPQLQDLLQQLGLDLSQMSAHSSDGSHFPNSVKRSTGQDG